MKKLISLLSAVALFATLLSTVAFADANNTYYIEESRVGNIVTLHYVLETNQDLGSASGATDLTDAYAKGALISVSQGADSTVFNLNATQKVLSWSIASTDGVTGTLDLGTLTLDVSSATGDITLAQKRAFTAKNTSKVSVASSFTDTAAGYVVTVGGGEFEAVIDANGIVSFNNYADPTDASAILSTNDVKVFSNKFSGVTADTRFDITHNGLTKTFGWTLGEYFGISGSGTVDGTLGVAVLFPKGDTNDFEITMR